MNNKQIAMLIITSYIIMGFITYSFIAPLFDHMCGYAPGALRVVLYGLLWPYPVICLIGGMITG
jgi:hypothetical protein